MFELKFTLDRLMLKIFAVGGSGVFRLIAFDSTVSNALYLCYQIVVGMVYRSGSLGARREMFRAQSEIPIDSSLWIH
ncbi:MAG: hypothetical protein HC849_26165 [Oscillatoriales cyanobacterium RU_3_3]|nr:hypothetical protein [Oscillatoriales cyanobacterium RU_3_3]